MTTMRNNFISTVTIPVQNKAQSLLRRKTVAASSNPAGVQRPKATMYVCIFLTWIGALIWFEPRLLQLLGIAANPLEYFSLLVFIFFIDFAWLYGIYNLGIVAFAVYYRHQRKNIAATPSIELASYPPVAILYTTCNDFVKESAVSCLQQDYPDYKLYLLDDSTDESCKKMIDEFEKSIIEFSKTYNDSDDQNIYHLTTQLFSLKDADYE